MERVGGGWDGAKEKWILCKSPEGLCEIICMHFNIIWKFVELRDTYLYIYGTQSVAQQFISHQVPPPPSGLCEFKPSILNPLHFTLLVPMLGQLLQGLFHWSDEQNSWSLVALAVCPEPAKIM